MAAGGQTKHIWPGTTGTTAFPWWSIQPPSIRLKPDWSWLTAGALRMREGDSLPAVVHFIWGVGLRVQNVAPIEPFEVDGDAYVPVRVKWQTKYAVRPIYLRLKGDNGGSIEFRIDPANGPVIGIRALDVPPRR